MAAAFNIVTFSFLLALAGCANSSGETTKKWDGYVLMIQQRARKGIEKYRNSGLCDKLQFARVRDSIMVAKGEAPPRKLAPEIQERLFYDNLWTALHLIELGEIAQKKNCLVEARSVYQDVVGQFPGVGFSMIRQRAQAAVDNLQEMMALSGVTARK